MNKFDKALGDQIRALKNSGDSKARLQTHVEDMIMSAEPELAMTGRLFATGFHDTIHKFLIDEIRRFMPKPEKLFEGNIDEAKINHLLVSLLDLAIDSTIYAILADFVSISVEPEALRRLVLKAADNAVDKAFFVQDQMNKS